MDYISQVRLEASKAFLTAFLLLVFPDQTEKVAPHAISHPIACCCCCHAPFLRTLHLPFRPHISPQPHQANLPGESAKLPLFLGSNGYVDAPSHFPLNPFLLLLLLLLRCLHGRLERRPDLGLSLKGRRSLPELVAFGLELTLSQRNVGFPSSKGERETEKND